MQFLEGFFGEDVEEFAFPVFEKLQHAFLFELLAVDILHKEFVAGEVAGRHELFNIFRKIDIVPEDVVRTDEPVCKNIDVQLDGITRRRIDKFYFCLAFFGAENINIANGFV